MVFRRPKLTEIHRLSSIFFTRTKQMLKKKTRVKWISSPTCHVPFSPMPLPRMLKAGVYHVFEDNRSSWTGTTYIEEIAKQSWNKRIIMQTFGAIGRQFTVDQFGYYCSHSNQTILLGYWRQFCSVPTLDCTLMFDEEVCSYELVECGSRNQKFTSQTVPRQIKD